MEKHLENKMRLAVLKKKGQAFKWVSPNTNGVPDRIVLMPGGKVYFVEMKFGKNGRSPAQVVVQKLLLELDFKVFNIKDNDELKTFLDAI